MGRDVEAKDAVEALNISIHSPCMGRDLFYPVKLCCLAISIHSPCMGRDARPWCRPSIWAAFQSTLPAWGETRRRDAAVQHHQISIHSPCMGRDAGRRAAAEKGEDFNPLSLHGERPTRWGRKYGTPLFQSTLPAWGETDLIAAVLEYTAISIHSPCMGRDLLCQPWPAQASDFNPLSLHGERPVFRLFDPIHGDFNPLSLHGERRWSRCRRPSAPNYFNPLSLHGERQQTHTTFRREKLAHLHNIVSFRQQRGSSC